MFSSSDSGERQRRSNPSAQGWLAPSEATQGRQPHHSATLKGLHRWPEQEDTTLSGLNNSVQFTQGRRITPTLGWKMKRRWRSALPLRSGLRYASTRHGATAVQTGLCALTSTPFGDFGTQSRRDFTRVAQRFNAGLGASGKPSPGGAKELPVTPPQSAVPDGTGGRYSSKPSVETLGYFRSSLRDAACETGWSNFRNSLRTLLALMLVLLPQLAYAAASTPRAAAEPKAAEGRWVVPEKPNEFVQSLPPLVPEGEIIPEITNLLSRLRPMGYVNAVAVSPDGLTVASADGKLIRLWDVATRKEVARLEGHTNSVNSVAFDPQGRWLASGSTDGTVRLWSLAQRKELARLEGHSDVVRSVAFDPQGRWLASGANDKTVRLWDLARRKELARLEGHAGAVNSVAFDPQGRWLASGSSDNTVRLWDLVQRKELARLDGHSGSVLSVAFDPKGRWLASGSDDNTLRLWDLREHKELPRLEGHFGSNGPVWSVAFDPQGRWLANGSGDNTLRLWDLVRREELAARMGRGISPFYSVAFDPNGKWLASGFNDNNAQLWGLPILNQLDPFEGHSGSVKSVAFDPQGRWLASGSDDKTVRLWDLAQLKDLASLEGHSGSVRSVAFDPQGRWLASASADGTIRLWSTNTWQTETGFMLGKEGEWLGFASNRVFRSEAGSLLLSADDSGLITNPPPKVEIDSLGTLTVLSQPQSVGWTYGDMNWQTITISNQGPGRVFWIDLVEDGERTPTSNAVVVVRTDPSVSFLEPRQIVALRFRLSGLANFTNPVSHVEQVFLKVVTAHDAVKGAGPLRLEPITARLAMPSLAAGPATITPSDQGQTLQVVVTNIGGATLETNRLFELSSGTNVFTQILGGRPVEPNGTLVLIAQIPREQMLSETNRITVAGRKTDWPPHEWSFPGQVVKVVEAVAASRVSYFTLTFLLVAVLGVVAYAWLFLNPMVVALSRQPADLRGLPVQQLAEAQGRLSRIRRLPGLLAQVEVQPEWLQRAVAFARERQAERRCESLLHRLGWKFRRVDGASLPVFEAEVSEDFLLNLRTLRLAFPESAESAEDVLRKLRQAEGGGLCITLLITTDEKLQAELRKETAGPGNFWVTPDSGELTQLHLAKSPTQALAQVISGQVKVERISPYQTKGGVDRAVAFFGREQLLAHIMAREPANYFVVGARQSGKSSLLKAIERGYAKNPEVECHYLAFSGADAWERIGATLGLAGGAARAAVLEALRKTGPGRRRLFLIDEADLFVAQEMARGYETLNQFRSLSEEGKCFFVLAGFWKLYEAAAFDYQSPIKNFGETVEVGPLEEEASRALATKPMAAMNLRYASDELVDTILRETGRRANLIAITCNELLKRLETGGRVIERRHVEEALASREIETALAGWEQLVEDPVASRMDKLIVYAGIQRESFTFAELIEVLRGAGCAVSPEVVKRSLARLDLAFIFKKDARQDRYTCPVPLFRKLVLRQDPEGCLREEIGKAG